MFLSAKPDLFGDEGTGNRSQDVQDGRGTMRLVNNFETAVRAFQKFRHDHIGLEDCKIPQRALCEIHGGCIL